MTYFKISKSPYYSFIFILPLLFIYEFGIVFISKSDSIVVRNGADFIMRQTMQYFGIIGLYGFGSLLLLGFILTYYLHIKNENNKELNISYFILMSLESLAYSIGLFYLLSFISPLLMNPTGKYITQRVTLAVGAGIYEEILFRLFLTTCISQLLYIIFDWNQYITQVSALFLSAVLFSAFHFLGEYGDYFSIRLFFIRIIAGLALGLLFLARGLGITIYTHSIYDLIVLTKITTDVE
mgnify:CR=1 FL=1